MAELAKSDVGQARIARATDRIDRATAAMGEQWRNDVEQPAAQGESDQVRAQVAATSSHANPFEAFRGNAAVPGHIVPGRFPDQMELKPIAAITLRTLSLLLPMSMPMVSQKSKLKPGWTWMLFKSMQVMFRFLRREVSKFLLRRIYLVALLM